jgi:transposase
VGIAGRTYLRWQHAGLQDQRQVIEKHLTNQLDEQERRQIIEICNQEEYRSQSPKQIVPALADQGIYLASESSFYRVLRAEEMLHHRGRTKSPMPPEKPGGC